MRRFATLVACAAVVTALVSGCSTAPSSTAASRSASASSMSSTSQADTLVRVASLRGPTTMGLAKMMADAAADLGDSPYEFTVTGTADEVVPKIVRGELDIALVPANLASVLYNRTNGGVQVADVNTLGVLEVLETGQAIKTVGDLKGKTIYSTGKGTTPEFVLKDLLAKNQIDPLTDVTIEYKSEASELVAALQQKSDAVALLPQPYVTILQSKSPEFRTALVLADEWRKVHQTSELVTGVTIVRTDFAAQQPAALRAFLDDHQASTEFVNSQPADAAPMIVAAGIVPDPALAEKAIPACNVVHLRGAEAKAALSGFLSVLFEAEPSSVGGALPDDDFYLGA